MGIEIAANLNFVGLRAGAGARARVLRRGIEARRSLGPRVKPIFLAAPDRGHAAHALVEALLRELQVATGGALKGSMVYVPDLAAGDTDPARYFSASLEAVQAASVVVAVLDGPQVDESVAFWMGYAFAASKPIVAYVTDARAKGAMVAGAVAHSTHDVRALAAALRAHL